MATTRHTPTVSIHARRVLPNHWDGVAFVLIIALFALAGYAAEQMAVPLSAAATAPISLDPGRLPDYALRTTLRMMVALVASLVFTFTYATLAAKSRRAERILVPVLDVLQSVPVLGYRLLHRHLLPGAVPRQPAGGRIRRDLRHLHQPGLEHDVQLLPVAAHRAEGSGRGQRAASASPAGRGSGALEVPFAMPGLVWNMMMSMSGGWFFVVASEAITVGDPYGAPARHRLLYRARHRAGDLARHRLGACSPCSCVILALRSAPVPPAGRLGRANSASSRRPGGARRNPGCSISCVGRG